MTSTPYPHASPFLHSPAADFSGGSWLPLEHGDQPQSCGHFPFH